MTIGMHHPMNETIDPSDVQLFVAVARAASFVGASRKTGVPTSSVSRAIARLEDRLGKRLLHRTSRRVTLTLEGAWLLERAAPLLDELGGALSRLGEQEREPSGVLRVTAPVMSGAEKIGPALIAFAAAHPRISLELRLTNAVLSLHEDGLDLAFRAGPITDTEVIAKKLFEEPFVLAAAPSLVKKVLRGRRRVTAARLAELPAVVAQPGAVWRFHDARGKTTELKPNARFSVNDPRVAVQGAKAGLGVVRAAKALVQREGRSLQILDCELGELEGRAVFAVYPSRRLLPLRVRAAIDWVDRALTT